MTMETQSTFCTPNDDGGINLSVSSQWLDLVQVAISYCLKMPQSKIVANFKRVGGGYGAKLSRSSHTACACALACHLLRMPVRFVMSIESNMTVMGKRYGCAVEYEAKIDSVTGRLIEFAPSVTFDFGCSLNDDISLLTVHSMMFSCYSHAMEWKVNVNKLKTDAPSATFCRGTCIISNSNPYYLAFQVK